MSRPPRCWVSEGIYHITIRGNNRQAIFIEQADYQQYLLVLHQCKARWPYRLLAFALLPNHVHLVVETSPDASFSDAMRQVGACYTRYFNARYHRVGHLYQGRFYSNLVAQEPYLREVTRYVHLNPVRARLCRRPDEYLWSSYRHYVTGEADPWRLVESARALEGFGSTATLQMSEYRRFVEERANQEEDMRRWLRRLQRQKLIPPPRWLKQK